MKTLTHLTAPLRKALNDDCYDSPVLSGRDRNITLGSAVSALSAMMDRHGFSLDMVCGDILLGDSGNRLLPFRVKHEDSFSEHPMIENSRAVFAWEKMEDNRVEVVAYIS